MKIHYPFENRPPPYAYDALGPYIHEKRIHLRFVEKQIKIVLYPAHMGILSPFLKGGL